MIDFLIVSTLVVSGLTAFTVIATLITFMEKARFVNEDRAPESSVFGEFPIVEEVKVTKSKPRSKNSQKVS